MILTTSDLVLHIHKIFNTSFRSIEYLHERLYIELSDGYQLTLVNLTKLAELLGTPDIHMESTEVEIEFNESDDFEWELKTWQPALSARLICEV